MDALPERLDAVVCNAAVYKPATARAAAAGLRDLMATNHFGHFLLVQLFGSPRPPATLQRGDWHGDGQLKELGGKIPIPAPADLGISPALKPV